MPLETLPEKIGPSRRFYVVTPSATAQFTQPFRAIWVNVGGDVVVKNDKDEDVAFTLEAGAWALIPGTHIVDTGTTASGIRVMF